MTLDDYWRSLGCYGCQGSGYVDGVKCSTPGCNPEQYKLGMALYDLAHAARAIYKYPVGDNFVTLKHKLEKVFGDDT